jgi:hypothetical protein
MPSNWHISVKEIIQTFKRNKSMSGKNISIQKFASKAFLIAAFSIIIAGCTDLDKQTLFKNINTIPNGLGTDQYLAHANPARPATEADIFRSNYNRGP